jgi:hypothetical protein
MLAFVVVVLLQDYIQRLMAEKADLDKRFHGMKDELIMRLQNACAQRDEARAQVSGVLGWMPKHCSMHCAVLIFGQVSYRFASQAPLVTPLLSSISAVLLLSDVTVVLLWFPASCDCHVLFQMTCRSWS